MTERVDRNRVQQSVCAVHTDSDRLAGWPAAPPQPIYRPLRPCIKFITAEIVSIIISNRIVIYCLGAGHPFLISLIIRSHTFCLKLGNYDFFMQNQ